MTKQFKEFLFKGLNSREVSNKYLTMDRVASDQNKIVVNVAASHLVKTQYGWALVLDRTRVVFLKDWQVSSNYFGNEVILDRTYFNVKTWGEHLDFIDDNKYCTFEAWLEVAKAQAELKDEDGNPANIVRWEM